MCKQFAKNPSGWLVLTGPSGSGKTHLAAAIANGCIERGIGAFFMVVPDLLDHLRSTYAPQNPVSYDQLFQQVRDAPVLILDDLGAESSTPWAEEKLFQLLNHRFNARLPTVFTLRVSLDRLDEGLRARMQVKELCRIIDLGMNRATGLEDIGGLTNEMLTRMTFQSFDTKGSIRAEPEERATLRAALQAAQSFARSPQGWLLLQGGTGSGKTHLAVAICGEVLKRGQSVFYVKVPDLLDHLRAAFGPESKLSSDRLFQLVKESPLLILDDLGTEMSTEWAEKKLEQLIVYRHDAALPTVITTHFLIEQLEKSRPRVASRLKDPIVLYVGISAPDFRDQQRGRSPQRPRRG
jgi:DNA replication protein DnaC